MCTRGFEVSIVSLPLTIYMGTYDGNSRVATPFVGQRRNSRGTGPSPRLSNAPDPEAHGGAGAGDEAVASACAANERPSEDTPRSAVRSAVLKMCSKKGNRPW